MEKIKTNKNLKEKRQNERYNNNLSSSPLRLGRSYDNTLNKNYKNLKFTSYNISTDNKENRIYLEKDNNIYPVNQSSENNLGYHCKNKCSRHLCPYYQHCSLYHIHFHHIHIPHMHYCPRINYSPSYRKIRNQNNNNDLLNEVAELRNEYRNIKEELERTKTENKVGNKYIKLLENTFNLKEKEKEKEIITYNNRNKKKKNEKEYDENYLEKENNLENKYHNMLDKSFEVLNSVSNKCDDKKGKIKGRVNYYIDKDPDYDELIEAQKKWLDNLPEKNYIIKKDVFNYNNNSTFSNTNETNTRERFNEDNNEDNYIYNLNVKDNYNEHYYQNMSDFNKKE